MLNKKIISDRFIGCGSDYKSADIVLFGSGFDGTTSYRPGARFGGKVIRAESYGLETYSPYMNRDLADLKVFDSGEIEIPHGNTEKSLDITHKAAAQILKDGKVPVMLGGEHLVTLPAVKACFEKYPDLRLIHFDAHTDLRDDYLGEKFSHACVIRRCWELLGDGRIYSYMVRSGTKEEFEWAKEHINQNKRGQTPPENAPVYLSIDLDVLDPSAFPATGTPEAGGETFTGLVSGVEEVIHANSLNIVGMDIVEYSPPYDLNGICAATAGKLLRELLLLL